MPAVRIFWFTIIASLRSFVFTITTNYDIYYIKELMRHDHVSTTEKYTQFTGMDVESRNEIRFIPQEEEIRFIEVESEIFSGARVTSIKDVIPIRKE